ncbi:hypothetical protein HS088_TW15G00290 [Tripterygium wilfordii]|uniref:Uncharacterized protein n=1 Tax=Tripterygium wilfordii TaxID=458696 RepID=A0A7J7CL43_TRIWF|nr:uncharacterized protein LOC120015896 [Tripterygium wilfordii]KAF5734797.1 hypothetical protein HS088_TW15G00290 [Tripterygium wilfordii]
MKVTHKDSEKIVWDPMRSLSGNPLTVSGAQTRTLPKLMAWLILVVSATYVVYTLKLVSTSRACNHEAFPVHPRLSALISTNDSVQLAQNRTGIEHIVFGIAASAKLWDQRKDYIKLWYKPEQMRGAVWLDNKVNTGNDDDRLLPPIKISSNTSQFPYTNRRGHRSAIRISRIVSETLGLELKNVRWFVMGDDDTVFITENLVTVMNKYDHNQYHYIGSQSESHLQNIYFSYSMAYGGGGFAISYPLAKALYKMQDNCIRRYPGLYGSDDRIQACMAELGVPLTKEVGFHQFDVHGNLFGLLAAHPVAPFVSLHHLDVVDSIFPNVTRVQALQRLMIPMKLDSAGLMQQSICYDKTKTWTISVSWGFAVQIFRGVFSPREIEMPSRTFLNWYKRADYTAYAFNTRPVSRNPCQKPFVFYMTNAKLDNSLDQTVSEYIRHRVPYPSCKWKMPDPAMIDTVVVYKKPDPHLWDRSPRRNCCRVKESSKKGRMVVNVGVCREGEISEV